MQLLKRDTTVAANAGESLNRQVAVNERLCLVALLFARVFGVVAEVTCLKERPIHPTEIIEAILGPIVGGFITYMFYTRLKDIGDELRKMRVTYEFSQARARGVADCATLRDSSSRAGLKEVA